MTDTALISGRRALRQPGVHGVSATAWGPGSQQYPIFTQYDGKLTVDGWTLDNNTWQGVRTFDASIGQWNTPDAYAGDVHDPMSQQPYMWNGNNPYAYQDPSGYKWEYIDPTLIPIVQSLRGSETFNEKYEAAEKSEARFTMTAVPADQIRETGIPAHPNEGTGQTALRDTITPEYGEDAVQLNRATVSIGIADKRTEQWAAANEVFNAGSAATNIQAFLKLLQSPDPSPNQPPLDLHNAAERAGYEGASKIFQESKL